jgi:hypothetical protein
MAIHEQKFGAKDLKRTSSNPLRLYLTHRADRKDSPVNCRALELSVNI